MFFVVETKLDKYDIISIENYTFINKPRKQKYLRKSGGIGAFIKEELEQFVTVLETQSEYVLWLKISKVLLRADSDLVIGITYVPPMHSRFFNNDEFEFFETEISQKCTEFENVILTGDFNAQTSNLPDYTEWDSSLDNQFDLDIETQQYINQKVQMETLNIPLHRNARDNKRNNHGYRLVNICKNNNIIILNGRTCNDKQHGKLTFRNTSTLDYVISSIPLFNKINTFNITELDELFSDGHSLIEFSLVPFVDTENKNYRAPPDKPKWNPNYADQFLNNISDTDITSILDYMDNSSADTAQENVDILADRLATTFAVSAENSFPTKPQMNNNNETHKKWYNAECRKNKKQYNKARKRYLNFPSIENKEEMKLKCRIYKRTMNKQINNHKKSMENKLRQMHCKNPKAYWKYLNSIKSKTKTEMPNLNELYEYFKEMNSTNVNNDANINVPNIDLTNNDEILNAPFSEQEISKCISLLKNNKSPGIDKVLNEYIKSTKTKMMPIYLKFFNLILNTGFVPSQWSQGIIVPIYKCKGNSKLPENYRPITLLSCMGKLFTSILNLRLNCFLDNYGILSENQAGFRKSYSTLDHIFTLNSLCEILRHSKQKLYCIFIDFSKAFDSISRVNLWQKLLNTNPVIDGKFLRVINNMYNNIKSCVSKENEVSSFFSCDIGVRQGENLSPVLFSLYLNDLEQYLESLNNEGGIKLETINDNGIQTFMKILVLLYADDTILISDNPEKLQNTLNDFVNYCKQWGLNINKSKTKALTFGSRSLNPAHFTIDGSAIENVACYKYLGLMFSKTGSFLTARKQLAEQANKALHFLYQRISNLDLPIDLILKLFDNTIIPILTYSSEIWGYEDNKILERVHCEFLRKISHLKKSTPLYMLYAEFGRHPIDITIKTRMIGFWNRLITGKQSKLSYKIYKYMLSIPNFESNWIKKVKNILMQVGRYDLWLNQNNISSITLKNQVKQILLDQNTQNWHESMQNSSKGQTYSLLKSNIKLENYLLRLNRNEAISMLKFRTANHYFPVETGRWDGTDIRNRNCHLCNNNHEVADEFHYLLKCPFFTEERNKFLSNYYHTNPTFTKYKLLLLSNNLTTLKNTCQFIKVLLTKTNNNNNL